MNRKAFMVVLVLGLLGLAAWLIAGAKPRYNGLTIGAAASLQKVLVELAADYETETGVHVELVLASSGKIAQQLQAGAPIDAVVLASDEWIQRLAESDSINLATRRTVVGNAIVIVTPARDARVISIDQLADPEICRRLTIGDPDTVPAGAYARQVLLRLGVWDGLQDRLIYAANVRQAVAYAARGEVDVALVYASDAMTEVGVRTIAKIPQDWTDAIHYPAAVTTSASNPAAGKAFLDWLGSPTAQAVFSRHGFSVPDTKAR